MTDRLKGCTVIFDRDIRDDDAGPLLAAISQMRGVLAVHPSITNGDDLMNRTRVRFELERRLYDALKDQP